jgi:hypothetical protein
MCMYSMIITYILITEEIDMKRRGLNQDFEMLLSGTGVSIKSELKSNR